MNRSPIRYTFCNAPFRCPVQFEHHLRFLQGWIKTMTVHGIFYENFYTRDIPRFVCNICWQYLSKFHLKVTPTTFWIKCKTLPKCTKFCSTRKLEVAAKNFGLLTKNCLMHWQIQGPKGSISGSFCVVCFNL